jgi:hypothetical protein
MASELLENDSNGTQDHVMEADCWLEKLPEDLMSVSYIKNIAHLS